ncbi:MAG: acyl-CoA synthetase, partial [Pseudomonadota bacterium]|nr:acyl-CoA synthetase [Pseudomonadota bacterium]
AKVTVDEFLQDNGQIAYQPILNVKYEYRMREPGNR